MKILIAGGAGYVGSALVPKLLERGYEVAVADSFWFGDHLPDDVHRIHKDIFELREDELDGYEQCIFMAGLSNDPMAEFSPSQNFISNAAAPAYLGYIAKRAGVRRFIFAGSCSVYGYTVNEFYDENAPAVSSYPYGISKLQGEQALLQMADEAFTVIALRKGTVCGYSPRMRLDLVVNTMFKTALERGEIVVNNPRIWRPVLSLQDAVSAYTRAVEAGDGIGGIFNIASGNYTVGELADVVKETLAQELGMEVGLRIRNQRDFRNYKVSTQKAEKILSFKPKHDVAAIVHDLIVHRDRFADLDNPAYYNIEVFKQLLEKPS